MRTEPEQHRGSGVWPVLTVLGAGLLLVLVAIAAGQQGTPTLSDGFLPEIDVTIPPAEPQTMPPQDLGGNAAPPSATATGILTTLASIVAGLLCLLAVFVLVFVLRRLWRGRRTAVRAGVRTAGGGLSTSVEPRAEVVLAVVDQAISIFDSREDSRDAVIAAWLAVESTAADVGLARGRSETASELAVRLIGAREGVRPDAQLLLALYEDVRYGEHGVSADRRAQARAALARLREAWT